MADPRRVQLVIAVVLAGVVAVLGVRAVRAAGSGGTVPEARALPALQPARTAPSAPATAGADAAPPAATSAGAPGTVTTQTLLVVHVAGAVRHPGVYEVRDGGRIVDAIDLAGGARPGADPDALNLAEKVTDGEQVVVPRRGEPLAGVPAVPGGAAAGATAGTSAAGGAGAAGATPAAPVDLNAATVEQLDALQGIGPALAQAILTFRTQHGRFASVDDLAQVPGIGPARLATLKAAVRVG